MKRCALLLSAALLLAGLTACTRQTKTVLQSSPIPEQAVSTPAPVTPAPAPTPSPSPEPTPVPTPEAVYLDPDWEFASASAIHTGYAVLYYAPEARKGIVIGVNAGHGTQGGSDVRTLCHPDGSAKLTGGSTSAGATTATAVSGGMTFADGTPEAAVTLLTAQLLRDRLLEAGYDVLMLRDSDDVQLDNVARTVLCNNRADVHISLHFDGDGLSYDKGCFYCSVPDELRSMYPVSTVWQEHERLGACLIAGLSSQGAAVFGNGTMAVDLTQTSYSTIPSVDIELGSQSSAHDTQALSRLADGLLDGIDAYFLTK